MRIVITGGTGFLGRPLTEYLAGLGYECTVLTRDPARARRLGFSAGIKFSLAGTLPPSDAVIHLAGESVASWWTRRKKEAILRSRVEGTRQLIELLRTTRVKPHTLLSASAIGIYGDRPGEVLAEDAGDDPRRSFRAQVCRAWEETANAADVLGVRVVNLRLGNVMDPAGGYLGALQRVFRLGVFTLGDPSSHLSWVSLEDAVRLTAFALANERWHGPLNLTAPQPLTQQRLAASIAQSQRSPHLGRLPAWSLRLALGEFSSALLDDQRVTPAKALAAGFAFRVPEWPTRGEFSRVPGRASVPVFPLQENRRAAPLRGLPIQGCTSSDPAGAVHPPRAASPR